MNPIYLDHAAATPILPEVLDAMLPLLREPYGNPSSLHRFGREARSVISAARDLIAGQLGCKSKELFFTGGGTESDNLALFGTTMQPAGKKNHIITTTIEHHAVLHSCGRLEKLGYEVTYLPVDRNALVSLEVLKAAIRPETHLISVMMGNNEVGSLQSIEAIGQAARERGVLFHVDAVQALGAVPIDLSMTPVDLMSFSAHKIGGPRGIGALYCSSSTRLEPILFGGSQERKKRAGTENPAAAAGFAEAVRIACSNVPDKRNALEGLRTRMIDGLTARLGAEGFVVNGPQEPQSRLPHILNISFMGCQTETLLMNLDLQGVAAASGSACTSGSLELSHVLMAMNLPAGIAESAVRFSFGHPTTTQEIDRAVDIIETVVKRIRRLG